MLMDMTYDFKIYVFHLNIGKPNMTSLLQTFTDNTTRASTSAKIKVLRLELELDGLKQMVPFHEVEDLAFQACL